ncbi:hypothetical protein EVAR_97448_1 [Eumeta japonica]|uniref:Uncharacterized protein n=1 Tax=Eumeta variegata TaxID=151549 RepID=A0A4C1X135_EUMVA|nr:hypothetical protein EVAR_97448_1 [Eumeta japonica]
MLYNETTAATPTAYARVNVTKQTTQVNHALVQARVDSLAFASQQQSDIITSDCFFSLFTEEEHEDVSERKENFALATFTSPIPKKRKRGTVTPIVTLTQ